MIWIANSISHESELDSAEGVDLTIAIDHIPYQDAEFIGTVLNVSAENSWHVILCVKHDVFFDSLFASLSGKNIAFLLLKHWGPSRLREFTSRYLQTVGKQVDTDAAYQFVKNCLAAADIPITPLLVAMYLRTFCEMGAQLTGLSFVRLLEKMEEANLDSGAAQSVYSLYNLRLFLRKMAVICFKEGKSCIDTERFKATVKEYFEKKYLDVDAGLFVLRLIKSGFIIEDNDKLGYSSFVFYSFYVAQAIEQGEIELARELQHIDTALRLGDAMSIYAGRRRDDVFLFNGLLKCIDDAYPVADVIDVDDLEKHIKHLLQPKVIAEKKDIVMTEALESTINYDVEDEEFARAQAEHRSVSKELIEYRPPSTKIEVIVRQILTLRFLYNVLRNMEHMDGPEKVRALDRILDHHMQCNMGLIDLYANLVPDDHFHSFSAYMVTLAGEVFLSSNVGATSLKVAIEELLSNSTNIFKRFLLISLYADLRLPNYASLFESFVAEEDSFVIIEMAYAKIYELLVQYEGETIPASLVSAFSCTFDKRLRMTDKVGPIVMQQRRDAALNEARRQHYRVKRVREME